ncbi:Ulvan-active sulfatase [Paenibacillus solanacearum]|uniref:Ulvan-active sulfatase n=1 Tax=Paenibacillus solanacearum TaxID=2048548 RepID=A0A916K7L1_9BACL|nr:sulfatase-like hydrolase/transferase [Paenibacillus solanacearum]CAG7647990.1 Ulvan-active sulfatase [Paenibacillus solanacearum]
MSKRPNIVFMIADDHRYSDIHSLHNKHVITPNFDRLAAGGTAFLNTHIMGGQYKAVCTPTRACVHTGAHVFKAVSGEPEARFDLPHINHTTINPELAFMPELLKQTGYATYATGKWHNDKASFIKGFTGGDKILFSGMAPQYEMPLHRFNEAGSYPPEDAVVHDEHATNIFCDAGIRFIEEYDGDDPFFLYIAFTSPHDPKTCPQEYYDMYDPADIPLPRNFMPVHPFDNGEMFVRDEALAKLPRDPQEICRHISEYYAMISHMDAEIGRVLDALERKGLGDDTIVVYTSDHGLSLGQHGLMGKQNLYDPSVRIPLIFRGPGVAKGVKVEALTSQMDIFPTLCALSDIAVPGTVDGKSMVPLMRGEGGEHYGSVFAIYKDVQRMVKTDTFKLIRYYRSERGGGTNRIQLFNHKDDPWETTDLATHPDYFGQIAELSHLLADWQESLGDPLAGKAML